MKKVIFFLLCFYSFLINGGGQTSTLFEEQPPRHPSHSVMVDMEALDRAHSNNNNAGDESGDNHPQRKLEKLKRDKSKEKTEGEQDRRPELRPRKKKRGVKALLAQLQEGNLFHDQGVKRSLRTCTKDDLKELEKEIIKKSQFVEPDDKTNQLYLEILKLMRDQEAFEKEQLQLAKEQLEHDKQFDRERLKRTDWQLMISIGGNLCAGTVAILTTIATIVLALQNSNNCSM